MEHLAVAEADLDAASSADEVEEEVSDSDEYDYEPTPSNTQLQAGCKGGRKPSHYAFALAHGRIPYLAVYDCEDGVHDRGYFIPGVPVEVEVKHCERDAFHHHHMLNPHLYTLHLRHGPFTWDVQRRYNDFQHLHRRMILHRANERLKAPVRRLGREIEDVFDEDEEEGKAKKPTAAQQQPSDGGGKEAAGTEGAGEDVGGIQLTAIRPVTSDTPKPIEPEARGPGALPKNYKLKRVPKFPLFPDAILQDSQLEERKRRLEKYLRQLLRISGYRNHPETAEFLEVSRLSFVANLGTKTKEGLVKKRPGGRKAYHGCARCCVEHCARWSKRWLVVKDSFVAYIDPDHEQVRAVLLYDEDFSVRVGASQTEGVKHGLLLSNQMRDLLLRCKTERVAEEWRDAVTALTQADEGPARPWVQEKRFGSYAPPRQNCYANWFSDGRYFMEQAANMLELAKEEIFIADWWLSPEIYMKRPMTEGNRWLLTEILKRKAEAGIRIFVLIYKEVEMALGLNSLYSKRTLQALHPNIRVLRHPDHVPGATTGTVMLWAHHEKLIVIDQMVAFVGGIDLCYGRWDDHRHRLTDLGSVHYHSQRSLNQGSHSILEGMRAMAGAIPALSPTLEEPPSVGAAVAAAQMHMGHAPPEDSGKEEERRHSSSKSTSSSASPTKVSFAAAAKAAGEAAAAEREARMELHAQADQHEQEGGDGGTAAMASKSTESGVGAGRGGTRFRSLMTRMKTGRSFSEGGAAMDGGGEAGKGGGAGAWGALITAREGGAQISFSEVVETYKNYVASGQAAADKRGGDTPPPERKKRTSKIRNVLHHWREERRRRKSIDEDPFMDYEKAWAKLTEEAPDKDDVDSAAMGGKLWIGKDYVNFIYKDFTDLDMPFMDFIDRGATCRMPWHDIHGVVYGAPARDVARHFIQRWNAAKIEKVKHDESYPFLLPKSYENTNIPRVFRRLSHRCNVQIIRSACLWSAGMSRTEDSIQQCYLHMIENAQHYIYIENQFFVTMLTSSEVFNGIADALLRRIVRAHSEGKKFRVYVNLPLMPAFEGQIGATGGSALQAVLYWTYQSISNGPHSLLSCLAREVEDPSRYVVFTGLRQHGELGGKLITELLYIHSKLMIVDDTSMIMGSANINDRSQMGKRDSEMAFYVEDTEFVDSTMDGAPYRAGKFSFSLRKWLFREHLGFLSEGADPRSSDERGQLNEVGLRTDVEDPVCDEFYLHTWLRIASKNTDIHEKVFRCLPTDEVLTFEELTNYKAQLPLADFNINAARDQLAKVQGHLVLFPTRFLCDSNLAPSIMTKEGMAPNALFT